jgi:hypothetical protein
MSPRRSLLRTFLALAYLGAVALAEETKSPWRSTEVLERRLGEACDAVEKACGAAFRKRPSIRISTPKEIEGLVREEITPVLKATGREDSADLVVEMASRGLLAKYDPEAHAIHVVPDNVDRNAELAHEPAIATEDGLRAVLAHEATHALDFERFPLVGARADAASLDELEAWGAVVEGHAQLVAEQVATAGGFLEAFHSFTRGITAVPDLPDELSRSVARAVAARLSFGYVAGLDFLKAVQAAKGREGVEAALREPPKTRRAIENPAEWLGTTSAKADGPDVEGAIAVLGPWFEDPAWGVETDALLRTTMAAEMASIDAARRDAVLASFEVGAVAVAANVSTPAQVVVAALAFRSPEAAAEFVAVERTLLEAKDKMELPEGVTIQAKYAEGAGPGATRKGFVAEKTIESKDASLPVIGHFAVVGRAVVQLTIVGKAEIDRARQDAGIDAIAAVLEGKAPAPERLRRRTPRLDDVWPGQEGVPRVTIRVVGPDGEPVPVARVSITGAMKDREGGTQTLTSDARSGTIAMPRLPGKPRVSVSFARDAQGRRMPLGPVKDVPVPEGETEITVRLAVGVSIGGVVVDRDGKPVAGVVVDAIDAGARSGDRFEEGRSTVRTDDAGAFVIIGLGSGDYDVVAQSRGDLAAPAPVRARGGATDVRIEMVRGERVTLTLVDEQGKPVPGVQVSVHRVDPRGWTRFAEGTSDGSGRYVLPPIDPSARYNVQAMPPERGGLTRTTLESWSPRSQDVVLRPGFVVRGVVRDAAGNALAGVHVDVGTLWTKETAQDGSFDATNLPRGPVTVRARKHVDGRWVTGSATATPEKPEVVVVLGKEAGIPEEELTGVVEEETERVVTLLVEGGGGRFLVLKKEGDAGAATMTRPIPPDGRLYIDGNRIDATATYAAWVAPEEPGRPGEGTSLLRRGVRFDGEPVRLVLEKGLSIRGRYQGPGKVAHLEIGAVSSERFVVPASIRADGTYEIRGLPPGTRWTVKAKARGEAAWLYATAEVEAGAEVDLTLAPK